MNTEFASANLTAGQLNAIVKKLGGYEGAMRFLRDELKLATPTFPLWKAVSIGVHKDLGVLIEALKKFRVSDRAQDILGEYAFTLAQTAESVDLCSATVEELTGKSQATTQEIFDAIKRIGDLCPAEVGPALREQYLDQPNGEWLRIAMEPICGSDGYLYTFNVKRAGDDLWLDTYHASPSIFWSGDNRFVFRFRK